MHLNWHDMPKCQIAQQFDDLLQQATCEVNQEIFEIHPMSFHVRLNANDLDEPTYKQVSQSDALELQRWQDAIDAKLAALQEKLCFDLVNQAEAEGRQIVHFIQHNSAEWNGGEEVSNFEDEGLSHYEGCKLVHGFKEKTLERTSHDGKCVGEYYLESKPE